MTRLVGKPATTGWTTKSALAKVPSDAAPNRAGFGAGVYGDDMRLVLAKGSSQYGSLRLHIDQLAAALSGLGHEIVVVDLIDAEPIPALHAAMAVRTDALVSFNGMPHEFAAGDFMNQSGAVFASFYLDHPVHHLIRLQSRIQRPALFFLDATHIAFMKAWAASDVIGSGGLLPPGANELDEAPDVSDEAFARRDIPLLFSGTYRGEPAQGWRGWPDSAATQIVAQMAERMAADGRLPLLEALDASLKAREAALSPEVLRAITPLLPTVQLFAEAYHRHAVLTALGAAEVPVQIYGLGWEPLCARYPSFQYGGVGSFEETLHLLRRARIVLSINNGFVAGGHERVFTAMRAGACVFSEASAYYAGAFDDGREIVTYDLDSLDRMPGRLLDLMADLPAQAAIARAGYQRATAEHRWQARAAALIQAIEAAR